MTFRKDNEVFEPVMSVLRSKKWGIYGPTSFQGYAKKNGLTTPKTAEYISVDHLVAPGTGDGIEARDCCRRSGNPICCGENP